MIKLKLGKIEFGNKKSLSEKIYIITDDVVRDIMEENKFLRKTLDLKDRRIRKLERIVYENKKQK